VAAIGAAVVVGGGRWVRSGGATWELVFRVTVWGVLWGVVGARLYHDLTSWNEVPDAWWGFAAVWKGGLGIWGAIAGGVIGGAVVARRAGADVLVGLDAVGPGLVLAQAIGRLGNWFNQELFGRPTSLPWGLEIAPGRRPDGYEGFATFQPTFLYELLWNLAVCATLLLVGRRFRVRPPALFCLYVALYTFGRLFIELLRIDPAHHIAGLRLNVWVSILVFATAATLFLRFRRGAGESPLRGE
jgi:prolipoprotein diacylglyceryl transferase